MKKVDATYNEKDDGFVPVAEGTYPSHVSKFESNEYNGSVVFNLTFKVAEEANKLEIPKLTKDNNGNYVPTGDTVSAAFVTGKTYRVDKGVWLTPNPAEGEGWKNKRYKEFFENLGVDFPSDKEGNVGLGEVEETDVIGLPCLIELRETSFTNKDGETKTSLKVTNVHPWDDGERLSEEEVETDDLPF
jgi:hypothetical protein